MTTFTAKFIDQEWEVPVESGRYHMIVGEFCPYAQRPQIARQLLGLDKHISISFVDDVPSDIGLIFSQPEQVTGAKSLRDIYHLTDPTYKGPYTIPILIDKTDNRIVCKESADMLRLFTTDFSDLHQEDAPVLFSQETASLIDNDIKDINNNFQSLMYKLAFLDKQADYDTYSKKFFTFLDQKEHLLGQRPFLLGDNLSEVDIHFFTPLVRWDIAGRDLLLLNQKALEDYPNIFSWAKTLYNDFNLKTLTNPQSIKNNYYLGKFGRAVRYHTIVPTGPNMAKWEK
ncbi:MAG: glutathione S-transferase C-terminal domain-containing protein [Streptococcus sp.]|nr:glutathione S-transferase C-terminal domain-containing protein [Streptococcus sp.]